MLKYGFIYFVAFATHVKKKTLSIAYFSLFRYQLSDKFICMYLNAFDTPPPKKRLIYCQRISKTYCRHFFSTESEYLRIYVLPKENVPVEK